MDERPDLSPERNIHPESEEAFLARLRELTNAYDGGSGFGAEIGMILGAVSDEAGNRYTAGAYLMRDVCVLAFNYAAHLVGASGFQASIAALQAYGSIVGKTTPFGIIDIGDALYPQYDLHAKVDEWIANNHDWLQKRAKELLAENREDVAPRVRQRWEHIAAGGAI